MSLAAYRVLLALTVLLLGTAIGQNINYTQDRNWVVPAQAAARQNPLAARPAAAAGGKKLCGRHCAECHNQDGSGLKHAADLRLRMVQRQTDGTLFWKISNGNLARNMPSFSNLPETQRWQIVLFLRTLKDSPQ